MTTNAGNRKAAHLSQSIVGTTNAYSVGDSSRNTKERRDNNMQTFLRSNCLGQINRNTWLFIAEKFGRFLTWNELTCNNQGIFFPVVGDLRPREDAYGKVEKKYWFFEVCAGAPNICQVQVYDAKGEKKEKMQIFQDSCGNVTNEKMELFMSWKSFIAMPPLPLTKPQ